MDLMNGAIPLGRWFGINVRIHIWFVIFLAFRLFQSGPDWRVELCISAMLFGIVLIHEFGHCFGARAVGGEAHDILMWPLGGLAFARAPMTPWAQFVTVACGPLVNLIFCIGSAAALIVSAGTFDVLSFHPFRPIIYSLETWHGYASIFFYVNYYLLLFNLLPIYPLDGGQLFQTLLWPFLGLQRAMILACQVGIGGAVVLFVLGVQQGRFILPAIAIFGALTCWQQLQAARSGMLIDERFTRYDYGDRPPRRARGGGFWARLFGRRPARPKISDVSISENPNPGGWEAKLDEERRLEAEVDRILKKVHEQGLGSLTYVERQTLERATRERQRR